MEIRQIRYLLAVAETGSFTKAAELVSISQPALSASIAKLEDEFQVKLLDRSRSRILPTEAGLRFIERADTVLDAYNSMRAELQREAAPQPLKIGILGSISSVPTLKLIQTFLETNAGVVVKVDEGGEAELQRRFRENRVDSLVTTGRELSPGSEVRILFSEKYVLAVPTSHHFTRGGSVYLSDLHDEPMIVRAGCEALNETMKTLSGRGIKPKIVYVTDQDDRALNLVAAGLGVAFVPELFETPNVTKLKIADLSTSRTIVLQWRSKGANRNLSKFIELATSHDWKGTPQPEFVAALRHGANL